MRYTNLGNTDISVSQIGLGCWGFAGGSMWGSQADEDSIATVAAALEAGINFFENAQGYGDGKAEEVLGKALLNHRHQAVIATKIRPAVTSAEAIMLACEQSLQRLQTDYIDLLQPHWPIRNLPIEETISAFTRLQEAGKIRAFGLSNYGVGDLSKFLSHARVVSNQLPYSLLFRAIEYELLPLCIKEGIGMLCYSTLLHGMLSGKYRRSEDISDGRARTRHFSPSRTQVRHAETGCEAEVFSAVERISQLAAEIQQPMPSVAIAWVLHQPGIRSAIVGARNPGQIPKVGAAAELDLDDQFLSKLNAATDTVKHILGSNPDMWMTESRFR